MSILMFVGRNGWGKSEAAIRHGVLPCWAIGRRVVSNISLYPEELGLPSWLYQPLNEPLLELPRLGRHVYRVCLYCMTRVRFEACRSCGKPSVELPRLRVNEDGDQEAWSLTQNQGCGLLLDEIVTMFPSRDSVSLPPELQRLLNQWRKPQIAPVLITCPDWRRADIMIRETVQHVVESRPLLPTVQRWVGVSKLPQESWGWPSYGWFVRDWFDPQAYELADESVVAQAALLPLRRKRAWLDKKLRATVRAAYDTQEGVELADHLSCTVCGGKTGRGTCKSPDAHRAQARAARKQTLSEVLTQDVLDNRELVLHAAQEDPERLIAMLTRRHEHDDEGDECAA